MRAYLLVRDEPHYRSDAFKAGLAAAGYEVRRDFPAGTDERGNVLIVWNRYAHYDHAARAMKQAGGTVLVAENGFIGKDGHGRQYYQLARDYHAGFGSWHVGEEDRWSRLGIELAPWRDPYAGLYALICEQRGIGTPPVSSPLHFAKTVAAKLGSVPHRIRLHPESSEGRQARQASLDEDLRGAFCVIVWTSTVGVHALVRGIPVIFCADHWIAEGAATRNIAAALNRDLLHRDDEQRLNALRRMAWSQWSVDEIATGLPFRCLSM